MNNKLLTYSNNGNNDYSPNIFIEKKETFEGTNSTINTLNEEIIKLKRKLTVLYDTEQQVITLKEKIKEITINNNTGEMNQLIINRLEIENNKIKINNEEFKKKILILEEKSSSLEVKNNLLLNKLTIKNTNIDKSQLKENAKIKVDIHKLKDLLNQKLIIKNDNIIRDIIKQHGIINNQEIDKETISNVIKSIIGS